MNSTTSTTVGSMECSRPRNSLQGTVSKERFCPRNRFHGMYSSKERPPRTAAEAEEVEKKKSTSWECYPRKLCNTGLATWELLGPRKLFPRKFSQYKNPRSPPDTGLSTQVHNETGTKHLEPEKTQDFIPKIWPFLGKKSSWERCPRSLFLCPRNVRHSR
jgi:hypothetical protein